MFIRLVIHLYRQYVQGTDDHINDSQISQTSTPARTEQNFISRLVSPVTTPADLILSDTEYEIASVTEISEQIKDLQTISKHLQEQLTSVNTKLDILLQKALDLAPISTINDSLEGEVQHVTINTTLEDEPQVIPGSSTYRDVATRKPTGNPAQKTTLLGTNTTNGQQISDLSGNNAPTRNPTSNHVPVTDQGKSSKNLNQRSSIPASQASPSRGLSSTVQRKENKILIISDSILSGVNRKGLAHNVECQPYPGAKIVTVHEKVHLFDLSKFTDIVIYVGGNDSSSNTDIELFEEKYEQLIQHIKSKNPSCEIHLCTSCPRGDTDVEDVNEVIKRLCEVHKVKCIDTNAGFYDKNQQLRSHFYKPRDNVHLSRSGIKRVLGLINETLYIVENFEKCVYPVTSQDKKSTSHTTAGSQRRARYGQHDSMDRDQDVNGRDERPLQNHGNHYRYMGRRRTAYSQVSETDNQYTDISRCLKCGLTNHSTDSCRHKTQVKCFNCKLYGHKDSSGLCRQK